MKRSLAVSGLYLTLVASPNTAAATARHTSTSILELPLGIGEREARKAIADTALHESFLLHRIQGRPCLRQPADAQQ